MSALDENLALEKAIPLNTAVPVAEFATQQAHRSHKCCGKRNDVRPTIVAQAYPAQYVASTSKELEIIQNRHQSSGGLGVLFIRLGHLDFIGRLVVPRKIRILTILHGSRIDLTQAQFIHPITDIEIVSVLGGCKVFVPDGVQVEMFGLAIIGKFSEKGEPSTLNCLSSKAPLLRIRGVSVLGCVKVCTDKSKPPVAIVDVQ